MRKKILPNLPNILSAFRILMVPVFVVVYFNESGDIKTGALTVYIIAFTTDALDGFVARKYNLISNLGKFLDPLGDKLMMIAALTCITIDGLIPVWVIIVMATKEAMMGIGGLLIHKKAKVEIPGSNIFGKTATVVFVIVCFVLMVFPKLSGSVSTAILGIAVGLTFAALLSYVVTFRNVMKTSKEEQEKIENKDNILSGS